MTSDLQPLPGWLAWPIRVLAVIFVVPFKLAWDALTWLARRLLVPFLKHVVQPVLYYALWLPFYYVVLIPLRWLTINVLWIPLVWFAQHVLVPVARALWWLLQATAPFWRFLGRLLYEVARAVAWASALLYRYVLTPIGQALAFVWRWVVVPVGQAIAWAWNHSVVLLWRYLVVIPLRFVWTYVVVPPARWVHTWVLRPIADTTRRVLVTLGLREPQRRHPGRNRPTPTRTTQRRR